MIGKTISQTIEHDGELVLCFTDGTALQVYQAGNEVDSEVGWSELDLADLRRCQARLMGERESARQQRLNRAGWMALSCEERAAKRKPRNWLSEAMESMIYDSIGRPHRREPCEQCGERECPNAKPAAPRNKGLFCKAGEMTISLPLLSRETQ